MIEGNVKNSSTDTGYKDRVDVPWDQLHNGNCSLVLKDVQLTDKDVYKCYLVNGLSERHLISSVKLSVKGK